MATVLETVKYAMLEYPTITHTVGEALHHLFCVNGNGMEWVNGELVDSYVKNPFPMNVKAIVKKERADFLKMIAETKEKHPDTDFSLMHEQELYEYDFRVAHIDRLVSEMGLRLANVGGDLYPYCEYAKIANVPDDVKDDWLWAAYHFTSNLQVYFRAKYSLSSEDQTWRDVINGVHKRFAAMLVERGLMASPEQQKALMDKILAELKAEEKAGK